MTRNHESVTVTIFAHDFQHEYFGWLPVGDRLSYIVTQSALSGNRVCVKHDPIIVDGVDHGCPPDDIYDPLDLDLIRSNLGNDSVFDALIASEELSGGHGYSWFASIQDGDEDTIRKTIDLFGGYAT